MHQLSNQWRTAIDTAQQVIQESGVTYDPCTYYYTPIAPYPRTLVPQVKAGSLPECLDVSEHNVMMYFHIPTCSRRCTFCPFFLDTGKGISKEYVDAVVKQVEMVFRKFRLPQKFNLYFGGGTPSLLTIEQLSRIIGAFDRANLEEVSMELHPECSRIPDFLEKLKGLGITRVSVGLQFIDEALLKATARGHSVAEVETSAAKWRETTPLPFNVDIMFGGIWKETIEGAQKTFEYVFQNLRSDWITAYQVCIPDGTAEEKRYRMQKDAYPKTDEIIQMRALRHQIASDAGYHYLGGDYFAREQTNPLYQQRRWSGKTAIIAIGPGTYSYILDSEKKVGEIWYGPFNTDAYMTQVKDGKYPIERYRKVETNVLQSWKLVADLKKGSRIEKSVLKENALLEKLYISLLLEDVGDHFSLSPVGMLLEDLVYASLFPAEMWESFSRTRSKESYTASDGKYDWFFEPVTVLKFIDHLRRR